MATVMNEMGVQGKRYGTTAAALHWLSAILITAQLWTGWTFHQVLERGSDARADMKDLHVTLGVLILAVVLIRIGHRLMKPAPAFPDDHPAWEQAAAKWGHRLVYAFMLIVPITGLIGVSGRGPTVELLGGITIPAVPGFNRDSAHEIGEIHVVLVYAFVVLLILHVLAALRHHGDRPSSARGRMWPSR